MKGKAGTFFRIILQPVLDEKKLILPVKFVLLYGNELADEATLTLPNGRSWQVRFVKRSREIWFQNGLQQFLEQNSISLGQFLIFKYKGSSKFKVRVFDMSTCEDERFLSKNKEQEIIMIPTDFPSSGTVPDKGKDVQCANAKTRNKGKQFDGTNSFKLEMKPYNIGYRSAYIGANAATHLQHVSDHVTLLASDGREWIVRINKRADVSGLNMTSGWDIFVRENQLKVGDTVIFEQVNPDKVVFNTTIVRSDDNNLGDETLGSTSRRTRAMSRGRPVRQSTLSQIKKHSKVA